MFNSLTSMIGTVAELNVLDCFAGSGVLSFEALSRGACHATMVDRDGQAIRAIDRNIHVFGCEDRTTIRGGDVFSLVTEKLEDSPFDLIFVDPPYVVKAAKVEELLARFNKKKVLTIGAVVVYECDPETSLELPEGFALIKEKEYGSTMVSYLQFRGA